MSQMYYSPKKREIIATTPPKNEPKIATQRKKKIDSVLQQILRLQEKIKEKVTQKHNNFIDSYADRKSTTTLPSQTISSANSIVPLPTSQIDFPKANQHSYQKKVTPRCYSLQKRARTPGLFQKRPTTGISIRRQNMKQAAQSQSFFWKCKQTQNQEKMPHLQSQQHSLVSNSDTSYLAYQSYGLSRLVRKTPNNPLKIGFSSWYSGRYNSTLFNDDVSINTQAFSNSQLHLPKHVSSRVVTQSFKCEPNSYQPQKVPAIKLQNSQPHKFVKVRLFKERQLLTEAQKPLIQNIMPV